jgi:hypothetical protein
VGTGDDESAPQAERAGPQRRTNPAHPILHLCIALSIAVVSVLGAGVAWRAEVHAAAAEEFDQNAVSAAITATQLQSDAEAEAGFAQSSFARYQRLGNEADRLASGACLGSNTTRTLSDHEARAACRLQVVFSGYNDPGYVHDGTFQASAYAADVRAEKRYFYDAEPAPYQAKAEQARHREDTLLYLSIVLVLTLALLTFARLTGSRLRCLLFAVPGWVFLAAGASFLFASEL